MQRRSFIGAVLAVLATPLVIFKSKPVVAEPVVAISMMGFQADIAKMWAGTKRAGELLCLRYVSGKSHVFQDCADYAWEICRADSLKAGDFVVVQCRHGGVIGGTVTHNWAEWRDPTYYDMYVTTLSMPQPVNGIDPTTYAKMWRDWIASPAGREAQLVQDTLRYAGELLYCGDPLIMGGGRPVGWTTIQHVPYATADAYLAQMRGPTVFGDVRRLLQCDFA